MDPQSQLVLSLIKVTFEISNHRDFDQNDDLNSPRGKICFKETSDAFEALLLYIYF